MRMSGRRYNNEFGRINSFDSNRQSKIYIDYNLQMSYTRKGICNCFYILRKMRFALFSGLHVEKKRYVCTCNCSFIVAAVIEMSRR